MVLLLGSRASRIERATCICFFALERAGGGTTRAKASKGNAKKAPGGSGGHKFEWSDKTNDGSTSQLLGALDSGDPMWSSGAEDENYVLVSGESAGVVPTVPETTQPRLSYVRGCTRPIERRAWHDDVRERERVVLPRSSSSLR